MIWGSSRLPRTIPPSFEESKKVNTQRFSENSNAKRFPLHGRDRAKQPLFQMKPGVAFTFHCLTTVLVDLKSFYLPSDVNQRLFTYHSCRIYLATSLGADKSITPEQIQAICRWQSLKSVDTYNRMQAREYVELLDKANSATIDSYTAANLPCISSFDELVDA